MVLAALRRLATALLAAVLAHAAWTFAVQAAATVRSPWSRDYGEGCVLAMAQLCARRGNYFVGLRDYPFLVANYPPVFIGATALLQRAFGPSLFAPRLLAFAATLGLLLTLYLVLRRLRLRPAWALAFTALFVAPWFVTTWAALARVDTTALLLTLAGLAVVVHRGVTRQAWPALVLFWLAFFTKQNAVFAPAAVLLDLALARDRRTPRAFASYAVPLAVLFGALVLATRGRAYRHLVPYTAAAEYEWARMGGCYLDFAIIAGPLLLLIGTGLAAAPREMRAGAGRTLLLYFLLNLAGLATIAKAGAAQNYFLEPWLATVLLAAWAGQALGERYPASAAWRGPLLLLAAAVANYAYPSLDRLPQALRRPENADEFPVLTRLVRETPGPVLSENLSLLVVNGREVLLEPFGILLLARSGLFRPDRLVRDCEAQRFSLVIVEHRMWEMPGFGECLERRYAPSADLGPYQALVPRRVSSR